MVDGFLEQRAAFYRKQAVACSEWSQRAVSPTVREGYARLAQEWETLARELELWAVVPANRKD
jgi:hypothetical protein